MSQQKQVPASSEILAEDELAELRRMTRETQQHARRAFARLRPAPQDDGEQS
jgi:signal transduction histidine kinase